jgi:glutathione synthase/RimK-type ligase-like ATP-grasp enzyme
MRLLLLTARPDLETNRRLEAAARARGVEMVTVDGARITAAVATEPTLRLGAVDLLDPPIDGVLARVGNWRPESMLAALEVAIAAGAATPNPPRAIRVGRDHWRTVHALAAAGLPVPATCAGGDPEELAAAAVAFGFPVVVKQRRSRMGVGVIRCATRDHLESVLDSLWRVGDEILIDGAVVNGSARMVGWLSGVVRRLQTGYLYHYAFAMFIGLAAMLGWLLFVVARGQA